MKCQACDGFLSDREASRIGLFSGLYLDLCERCISTIPDLEYTENPMLSDRHVMEETVTFNEDSREVSEEI